MSRSAGPGSPIYFRCAKCRTKRRTEGKLGMHYEVTGRARHQRSNRGNATGVRHGTIAYEYRCLDCQHVGWSRHDDLARAIARQKKLLSTQGGTP